MNRTALLVLPLIAVALLLSMAACEPKQTEPEADTAAEPVAEAPAEAPEAATAPEAAEQTEAAPAAEEAQPAEPAEPAKAKEAAQAGEPAETAEAKPDIPAETVVATVGDAKITAGDVRSEKARFLKQAPPQAAGRVSDQQVLDSLIRRELMQAFAQRKELSYEEKDFEEMKAELAKQAEQMEMTVEEAMAEAGVTWDDMKLQLKLQTYVGGKTGKEQLQAYVDEHKDYFDGTQVSASHILITTPSPATTADQKQAVEKLQALKKQVEAGEMTFAEAATANSACPSKKKGGDLGSFAFPQMVPPFAAKAFSMKDGEISDVVRTQFGFHLIKKTGVDQPGEDAQPIPPQMAEQIAGRAISSQVINDIMDLALGDVPVVLTPAGEKMLGK